MQTILEALFDLLRQLKVVKVGVKNIITPYYQIRNNKYSITDGK